MIFLELVLQNFGPYAGKQVINLDTRIDRNNIRPIILLGGMNGGGKTTLMDAIRLALYGARAQCSTRGNLSYGDFLTQCVNNKADPINKTRIELVFEHIEDDKPVRYRVVRTWEKNPKDGKDSLGILGEDETWPQSLANIWDEYIENILPLGISNLFLFDGEQVKELAEQEVPPPIVVDAINGLLGLELVDKLSLDLEILVNRKKKENADDQDLAKLEELENRLHKQMEQKNSQKAQLQDLEEQVKNLKFKYEEALNKYISEGGKIAGERSQLDRERETQVGKVENLRKTLCQLADGVLPLQLISNLLSQVQLQGEKELRLQQIQLQNQVARDILTTRDKRLLSFLNQLNLELETITSIENFLVQDIDSLYVDLSTKLYDSEPVKANNSQECFLHADEETLTSLDRVVYGLPTVQNNAKNLLLELRNCLELIVSLDRQIQAAAPPEAYIKLQKIRELTEKEWSRANTNLEILNRQFIDLTTTIDKTKKELNSYTDKNLKYQSNQHLIDSVHRVQENLKLFKEKLTLRKLNKLEEEVKNCFLYLLHKSDLVYRVGIDSKSFQLSLYDLHGKLVPKHRLSAGEKQLLAIAFLWGLAKVSGKQLPVAIDTPLGRLDSSHRNNLLERYFPTASHQVILLSTDTEIARKEIAILREHQAIAREYVLEYDSGKRETSIKEGYFW
ncbi:DNA sulfur modification protein DndD [Cylindrospermopsis raciborskii]|uniref:DNA sulfur modification protein DndD n=1 Tax=Cylindrospermopsis raciborskii TaxID=77022 RepID=UPI0008DE0695|nr:DNA sulfur modification protein DndD [Cylindrospermopsis raciborskii]MCZ2205971.1 DNA sulfur modification protein DndD [Cylindrospermopsis raciborskii PAMP2011]NLQ04275.1 DNA sulfur modification protein DndD [Cylindrospermopsis raciborskii MVCC19]OHY33214.1 DNA sulfur modification protein DndD [Cylindrospermopsis raciborskii MVCC14]